MENRTTFVIAHRIQSIMNADQILVFDQGKIVQKGKHKDLVNQAGIYRDIYDIQSRIESALQEEIERVDL
jgi:ABC-type multidrug transport system fused ATPase/permease subunit